MGQVVRGKAREQGRVLGQLGESPEGLPLYLLDECRPAPSSRRWGRWLKRLTGGPETLHDV
jgi:hypothetical protein